MRATSLLHGVAILLALLLLGGCTAEVYHDLDEGSANEMVVVLQQHGIDASKSPDPAGEATWLISVPSASQVEAWRVLQTRGLPKPQVQGFEQVFASGGLVPTASEERMKYQYATSQELRRSLLSVDGIVDANVNLVLPEKERVPMPNQPKPHPRASVLIAYRADVPAKPAPPMTQEEVRRLVAGGVEGMSPEHVEVIFKQDAQSKVPLGEPAYVQLGPLSIAPQSQGMMQLLVGVIVTLMLALVGLISFLALKMRKPAEAAS